MKVQSIIAKHLKEAIHAAGTCKPHDAYKARVHMEFVAFLNFMWRDNSSWVDENEEYEKFLDSDFGRQFKSKRSQLNVVPKIDGESTEYIGGQLLQVHERDAAGYSAKLNLDEVEIFPNRGK